MKIAIYGHPFDNTSNAFIYELFDVLSKKNVDIIIYGPFKDFLSHNTLLKIDKHESFSSHTDIASDLNMMISIGGDGTFLETINFVRDKNIPIVGINSGRLGFLANIAKNNVEESINDLLNNNYTIEERTLIELDTNGQLFNDFNFALNEVTIQKAQTSSMIKVEINVNDEHLNTFWTDGIIISTPTGSTAYNLSAGGPIVVPNSHNFIITPILPHNLTARPIVLNDNNVLTINVTGRSSSFLCSLDSNSETFSSDLKIKIRKAGFSVKVIKLKGKSFYKTLRDKLMWGADKRLSS